MKQSSIIEYIYGVFLIIGGIMGYKFANSIPSLVAGIICGILIILCAIQMTREKKYAFYTALGLSVFLTIFFGYRFSIHMGFHAIASTLFSAFVAVMIFLKILKLGPNER